MFRYRCIGTYAVEHRYKDVYIYIYIKGLPPPAADPCGIVPAGMICCILDAVGSQIFFWICVWIGLAGGSFMRLLLVSAWMMTEWRVAKNDSAADKRGRGSQLNPAYIELWCSLALKREPHSRNNFGKKTSVLL